MCIYIYIYDAHLADFKGTWPFNSIDMATGSQRSKASEKK